MTVEGTVRSFVDLRGFAADAAPAGDLLDEGDILALPAGPVRIAALALSGEGRVAAMPVDTFAIVLRGTLAVDGAVQRTVVLPAGSGFAWRADPGTLVVTMRCTGAPGAGRPVAIDEAAPLEPSGAPLAGLLVGPTPSCRNHTDYRSANGEFVCGTWDSTPYHRLPMPYRHYELMHLIAGDVTFEDEAGRRATFTAGDVFLVEQGARCSWHSGNDVKKVYAIHRPA